MSNCFLESNFLWLCYKSDEVNYPECLYSALYHCSKIALTYPSIAWSPPWRSSQNLMRKTL